MRSGVKMRASLHETALLRALARLLHAETERLAADATVQSRAHRFMTALRRPRSGPPRDVDVLTLNFDLTLLTAAFGSDVRVKHPWRENQISGADADGDKSEVSVPAPLHTADGERVRVWYPHGHCMRDTTMVCGVHRYTRSASYAVGAFGNYHAWRQGRGDDHELQRKDFSAGDQSWVSIAINSPLLLLGAGLSRSETDLWAFLHLRARNHANVPPAERPKIYRLACGKESDDERKHWASLSEGIAITDLRLGATWDEAWEALFMLLESGDGLLA